MSADPQVLEIFGHTGESGDGGASNLGTRVSRVTGVRVTPGYKYRRQRGQIVE